MNPKQRPLEERAKDDFRVFLYLIWKHLGLPKPTQRQLSIATYLQKGPKRRVIQAFRGVGKSWVTAAFVLWMLYKDKNTKILVVSASKQRADNFTTFCLQLIRDCPMLQHLNPTGEQRCSKVMFDVAGCSPDQQPSVTSLGITSALAGNRANLIVADDIEVLNNSATHMMREKLSEAIKEFDAILKPDGDIVFLGTPQNQESTYNKLPTRGYHIRKWYARYPSLSLRERHGVQADPEMLEEMQKNPALLGKTAEPTRFSDADLTARELSLGKAGFALQYMLDTELSDVEKYPLRMSDLPVWNLTVDGAPDRLVRSTHPDNHVGFEYQSMTSDRLYWADKDPQAVVRPYQGVVMAIDPGGRGKDETAYAVVAHLMGIMYLLDAGAVKGYSEAALTSLATVAKDWKVNCVLVESNMGDGMFSELLKPILTKVVGTPVGVEEVRHSTQKELRICDTLEPIMSQGRLIANAALFPKDYESVREYPQEEALLYTLFYQLTHMTRLKGAVPKDDRADALQMAVAYWVKTMAQDVDRQRTLKTSKDKEAILKKAMSQYKKKREGNRPKVWG